MRLDALWGHLNERIPPLLKDYRRRVSELEIRTKSDRTLLTEADLEVQDAIIAAIKVVDPLARIVAEEARTGEGRTLSTLERTWVIDPIDGTAQFVRPSAREYCSVVCLVEEGWPTAAYILAPELGIDRRPLAVMADRASQEILIDGTAVATSVERSRSHQISATRSSDSSARAFEDVLLGRGYRLKTRTTSQTLDMLRTAVDLEAVSDAEPTGFDLFYRREQSVWDGVAGMCVGSIAGLEIVDEGGVESLPARLEMPPGHPPRFPSTVMGAPEVVAEFVSVMASVGR